MDRSPPSFFNQGPSAHARLAFFALLAVALLVIDARSGTLGALRQGIGTVLYPLQRTLLVPRDLLALGVEYFSDVDRMRTENAELRRLELVNARALLQAEHLAAENAQLRALLGARERAAIPSTVGEVLYDARDPYSRRVIIDRGLQHGVLAGQPVLDAQGVAGQVTRTLPLSSEVTLLTDRTAAIPIEVPRTGQRSIAFASDTDGLLELRFLSVDSPIEAGDSVVTSGLDGLYPPGLPVGVVLRVEPTGSTASLSRVLVQPVSRLERNRALLVLLVERKPTPAPPEDGDEGPARPAP